MSCIGLGYYVNDLHQQQKKAMVGGKYRDLLRKIHVPSDKSFYGHFRDHGYWSGLNYAGESNLPEGYWVYVAPNWYIWRESNGNPAPKTPHFKPPTSTSISP